MTVSRNEVKKIVENASEKKLEIIYHFFEAANNTDWWDKLSNEQKSLIDKGLAQLDNGKGFPHTELNEKVQMVKEESAHHSLRKRSMQLSIIFQLNMPQITLITVSKINLRRANFS